MNPLSWAIGGGCTFVARSIDIDVLHLEKVMARAATHRGTSLVEVYQDCNIYNHQTWFYASQKKTRPDSTIQLEHDKPMIFGADSDKGLQMDGTRLKVVQLGNGVSESDVLVHDETDRGLAFMLTQLLQPEFPEPLGIIYASTDQDTYDHVVHEQLRQAIETDGKGDLYKLLHEGETWVVEDE